jgi:predicted nucleic acid-binding protein
LGDGETECLLFTIDYGHSMASDDRKARTIAQSQIGGTRVTGSLGLLRNAVRAVKLSQQDAMTAYTRMQQAGAFLPTIDATFFT